MAKINQPAILTFLATMDDHPRKRNHGASYLRIILAHARAKGLRADNPAESLGSRPRRVERQSTYGPMPSCMTAWPPAEALGRRSIATAMLIAHDQGFRPTDTLRLQKGRDYDAKTGRFKFRCQKTASGRMRRHEPRPRAPRSSSPEQLLLIVNEDTGKVYNERVFIRWFDKARGAKHKHLWFRELRHTHVVKARRAGSPAKKSRAGPAIALEAVDKILEAFYSPHDTEVIQRGAAKFEAYLLAQERKSDTEVGR